MALHRKLRGSMDMPPQYIRIPTSRTSGQGAGHSLHERQPRARRLYTQRYVASDRSRKISSLQLRACFMLCVLLYFGAIYFADDITNLGRVVGSEQNNKSFFVHSLQPRGRGNVRVGRAVDAKRVEAIAVPTKTVTTLSGRTEAGHSDPPSEIPEAETVLPQFEPDPTTETNKAQPPDELRQKEMSHLNDQITSDGDPGDEVHPDDQVEAKPAQRVATSSTVQAGTSGGKLDATPSPRRHRYKSEAQPTAAQRRPEQQQTDEGSKSQDKGVSQEGQMQQQLNHQAQISGMPIAKQASG